MRCISIKKQLVFIVRVMRTANILSGTFGILKQLIPSADKVLCNFKELHIEFANF